MTTFLASFALSLSAAPGGGAVVPLKYGTTSLNLTGRGLPSRAMLARRENFNAHGFDVLTLYVLASQGDEGQPIWQIVPAFEKDAEQLTQRVGGGADCTLHDFRLVSLSDKSGLQLITADRELGDSYASEAAVTFKFYELKKNSERLIGRPLYYFEMTHSLSAGHTYCDVEDAFQSELGLTRYLGPARR